MVDLSRLPWGVRALIGAVRSIFYRPAALPPDVPGWYQWRVEYTDGHSIEFGARSKESAEASAADPKRVIKNCRRLRRVR